MTEKEVLIEMVKQFHRGLMNSTNTDDLVNKCNTFLFDNGGYIPVTYELLCNIRDNPDMYDVHNGDVYRDPGEYWDGEKFEPVFDEYDK